MMMTLRPLLQLLLLHVVGVGVAGGVLMTMMMVTGLMTTI
jgi:hypothetical protein